MARLATFNYTGQDGTVNAVSKAILINSSRVKQVSAGVAPIPTVLVYVPMKPNFPQSLYTNDSVATVRTELNTDNTTNTTTTIPLTFLNNDGTAGSGVRDVQVQDIIHVEPWPTDATDSLVILRTNDNLSTPSRVAETMAAIKTAANA